jgi:hypothetical protein
LGDDLPIIIFAVVATTAVIFAAVVWFGEDQSIGCGWMATALGGFGITALLAPTFLGTCWSEPCEYLVDPSNPDSILKPSLPSIPALLLVLVPVLLLLFTLGILRGDLASGMNFAWAFGCFILARIAYSEDSADHMLFTAVGAVAGLTFIVAGIASASIAQKREVT